MASSLTSTSLKSGYIYLVLIAMVLMGVVYLLIGPSKPHNNLRKHAFYLTNSAFKNGIYLAHSKFQLRKTPNKTLNIWSDNHAGLDFNDKGYPIGTSILDPKTNTPLSKEHCIEIWKFILGPLQPSISTEKLEKDYWVEIDQQKKCIYLSSYDQKMQLSYHSLTGKTKIVN